MMATETKPHVTTYIIYCISLPMLVNDNVQEKDNMRIKHALLVLRNFVHLRGKNQKIYPEESQRLARNAIQK